MQRAKLNSDIRNRVLKYDKQKAAKCRLQMKLYALQKNESNKLRQSKFRKMSKIPKDRTQFGIEFSNFLQVARQSPGKSKIVANTVEYFNIGKVRDEMDSDLINPLPRLKCFKEQNRVKDLSELAYRIKKWHGSYRKAARFYHVRWQTFLEMVKPNPTEKVKSDRTLKSLARKEEVGEFYSSPGISNENPRPRACKKRYLTRTVSETYNLYVKSCDEKKTKPMSQRHFMKCRPKQVKRVSQTPDNECLCEKCENEKLIRVHLHGIGLQGIPKTVTDAISYTICPDIDETDGHIPLYGKFRCIMRECGKCGSAKLKERILKENPGIEIDEKISTWKRWELVKFEKITKMDLVFKKTTKIEIIDQWLEDLDTLSLHRFQKYWQYEQFRHILNNLPKGVLLQVLDFGKNYLNKYQNAPQSTFWHNNQTMLHPIVNYYVNDEGDVVTEEHMHMSGDKVHDKYAVNQFQEETLKKLEAKGIKPKYIVQWCDNCSAQYKSKGPFEFLSLSGIPVLRCYFGPRHGKGPADGVVGRTKQCIVNEVKRGTVLRDAKETFEFVKKYFKQQSDKRNLKGKKKTFIQECLFHEVIDRSQELIGGTLVGSSKLLNIRSTGHPYKVEGRPVTCLCLSCLELTNTPCPNYQYVGKWKMYDLRSGKEIKEPLSNKHWNKNFNVDTEVQLGKESDSDSESDNDHKFETDANDVEPSENVTDEAVANPSEQLQQKIMACKTYKEMEKIILNTDLSFLESLEGYPIAKANYYDSIDTIATTEMPQDRPLGLVPLKIYGDGNCLVRAVSKAIFGSQVHYADLRLRMVVEGVKNRHKYFENDYLRKGCSKEYGKTSMALVIAQYYDNWVTPEIAPNVPRMERIKIYNQIVLDVYKKDMLDQRKSGTYASNWQLFQLANVICRPIQAVFPERGGENFRKDFNRTMYPYEARFTQKETLCVMWTPSDEPGGRINHFVPLLES